LEAGLAADRASVTGLSTRRATYRGDSRVDQTTSSLWLLPTSPTRTPSRRRTLLAREWAADDWTTRTDKYPYVSRASRAVRTPSLRSDSGPIGYPSVNFAAMRTPSPQVILGIAGLAIPLMGSWSSITTAQCGQPSTKQCLISLGWLSPSIEGLQSSPRLDVRTPAE
jgi:hypothetical protein